MSDPKKIFGDASKAAGSAFSVFGGIKEEISGIVKGRVDEILSTLHLVRREEFEIMTEIASRTRSAQEKLEEQVQVLEERLAKLENKNQ
ncbi:Ubiquinone biosynthesis accessory factor UbiK (UbiK) (PUBMED:28559279) [Commensalibacter communis]|uniref:Ubiquinone biosynthesis accessory factor UbiK (UbiK) (PUBMED:28559279) n=1 Tax=Commensalibacter communis TaxID=2972786 RepID=A0A9W4TQ03_9PROT|nr:accessory factor UbiK family protein [Commensalibacter communis]CAI3950859.1 Ubiquinone biosynthesis accessory factor UbiK (UbiK) (PUBMED:28559279) [Commensalibacter communis]CAI3951038.1 Ubiquinone biosynthesis accessory factor UbiK (UbiK) (PUBMED:28559279) [Commensalibacter communis]CAI3952231.1 Ubiquinone biosynthesis accessory factor UbiK (UbiK) (PUBMED:28559279) [Commensalibacter communis]CAI3954770.1 Ubiquinone biosynthesis accessory factor UbiK (UbiK) (PUBMED:28559279) [Commensalibact